MGGCHHNGVAEKSIKDVTRMTRTTMIHAALRWPSQADKSLWPLAMGHSVFMAQWDYLPEELWNGSKYSRSYLKIPGLWIVHVMF